MVNRSNGAYARIMYHNFAVVISIPGEGCYETVQSACSSRRALGMAFRGLPKGGKVLLCKREDEMTNDEKGRWGMPSYRPERTRTDYSVLDQF